MTSVIPRPRHLVTGNGTLALTGEASVAADRSLWPALRQLRRRLQDSTGFELPTAVDATAATIRLTEVKGLATEGYRLTVDDSQVRIEAAGPRGALHAIQTLLQLLPPQVQRRATVRGVDWQIEQVEIEDEPEFVWRAVMLDVARHFLPKQDVLRFIDLAAMHRLNTLHWHLTDDQGWRVQILRYPRLTEIASWRAESTVGAGPDAVADGRPHGGFYTQDDIREIVAYAEERGITIVPEIDLPGHSQAAITAYPQLGLDPERQAQVWTRWGISTEILNLEEDTVTFFCNVLDELLELFPGTYIGVGGDECPKGPWEQDERTQQLMRERGLADEEQAQAWFMGRLVDHLSACGRKAFGWDELLEGDVPDGTLVASWRGMTGARTAIRRGLDVVACPDSPVYLDYRQSDDPDEPIPVGTVNDVERVYGLRPIPDDATPEQAAHVLGGQGNIWTEHIDSARVIDYFAYPRVAALAEVLWSGPGGDFANFSRRLDEHLCRLDEFGVEYRQSDGPHPWQRRPGVPGRAQSDAERAAHLADLVASIAEPDE
ncbi:beta-N-acetylhexosaminidase [Flexivirga sp. B27]